MESIEPFLQGPEGHRHFYVSGGAAYCVRGSCDGCALSSTCEFDEVEVDLDPLTHVRRGVAVESVPFLVLRPRGGVDWGAVWSVLEAGGVPEAEKAFQECNLHFMLRPAPGEADIWVGKEQIRWYGSRSGFDSSDYAGVLEVVDSYAAELRPMSLDFAAIEPRVNTVVSREPLWEADFAGESKVVYREVELDGVSRPSSVGEFGGGTYCWLVGDLDKGSFGSQCGGCPARGGCRVVSEHRKDVPKDWHGTNCEGLYGDAYVRGSEDERKALRSVAKAVGLAISYGGSSYAVSRLMGVSEEVAKDSIGRFFVKLPVLRDYMNRARSGVRSEGVVSSRFGRARNMGDWLRSGEWKRQSYVDRTALNHPVQSLAADIMKLSQIRADRFIVDKGLHPYMGLGVPRRLELREGFHRCVGVAQLSSVHDESVFVVRDDLVLDCVPLLYGVMQLDDVMCSFGSPVRLELDVEYDKWRAWTASETLPAALVYLLNCLRKGKGGGSGEVRAVVRGGFLECRPDVKRVFRDRSGAGGGGSDGVKILLRLGDGDVESSFRMGVEELDRLGVEYVLEAVSG